MEVTFVSNEEMKIVKRKGPKTNYDWDAAIEAVAKQPNVWAKLPFTISAPAVVYKLQKRIPNLEVACSGGNSLSKKDPRKKEWSVYMRVVTDNEPTNN